MALKKNAVQSTGIGWLSDASGGVDGNRETIFDTGSCTLTNMQSNPWWRVDLLNVYTITAVMITNRIEHDNRTDGAEIWIGHSEEINDKKSIR